MGLQILCNCERGVEKGRGVGVGGGGLHYIEHKGESELRLCHIFRLHIYGPHI